MADTLTNGKGHLHSCILVLLHALQGYPAFACRFEMQTLSSFLRCVFACVLQGSVHSHEQPLPDQYLV